MTPAAKTEEWPKGLAHGVGELAPTILSREDLGFCDEAADLLVTARAQAERWDHAARTRFRTAKRDGHREGREAGKAEVLAVAVGSLAGVERARQECEGAVHALVLSAIERFFAEAPFAGLIRASVSAALADLEVEDVPTLGAHPTEIAALEQEFAGAGIPVRITEAPELSPDEVELRLVQGRVTISLDRHLETLRRVLGEQGMAHE